MELSQEHAYLTNQPRGDKEGPGIIRRDKQVFFGVKKGSGKSLGSSKLRVSPKTDTVLKVERQKHQGYSPISNRSLDSAETEGTKNSGFKNHSAQI